MKALLLRMGTPCSHQRYPGWGSACWRAPALPPEDMVVEFWEKPDVWVFVRARDVLAPRVVAVIIPTREYSVYVRETVVENRTVVFSDRHYAVNPGIPAAFVAAAIGRPLRS